MCGLSNNDAPKAFRIAVLPGDGVGEDVTQASLEVLKVVEATIPGLQFEFEACDVGAAAYLKHGDPLSENAYETCRSCDAVLLGAMGLPNVRWPDGREMTPQIDLRERLDLYAGVRPIYLYHTEDSPLKGYDAGAIDFVIVRENCEGLFSTRLQRFQSGDKEVCDVLKVTRFGAERICRFALELARSRRKRCTLVDKANVLPSMVYLRHIFDEVAKEYPDVHTDHVYVDAVALYLIERPQEYDVLVTENMFGDILSDQAAGLIGGMGMAPSADLGEHCGVFQPSHGTAPDIAGKGIANPVACILSAAMMLEWLKHTDTIVGAQRIREAVRRVYSDPENRTPDMGGQLTTQSMTEKIIQAL